MIAMKEQALEVLDELHATIDYADYCTIHDGLTDIEPLSDRDRQLEELWERFSDIPMDPDTENIEEQFLSFSAGTNREEIWHWFDERHSKGVVYLLGFGKVEYAPELQKLFRRRSLCLDCDSETCAFNPDGVCMYPVLYGKVPEFVDDVGCKGFLYKEDMK